MGRLRQILGLEKKKIDLSYDVEHLGAVRCYKDMSYTPHERPRHANDLERMKKSINHYATLNQKPMGYESFAFCRSSLLIDSYLFESISNL